MRKCLTRLCVRLACGLRYAFLALNLRELNRLTLNYLRLLSFFDLGFGRIHAEEVGDADLYILATVYSQLTRTRLSPLAPSLPDCEWRLLYELSSVVHGCSLEIVAKPRDVASRWRGSRAWNPSSMGLRWIGNCWHGPFQFKREHKASREASTPKGKEAWTYWIWTFPVTLLETGRPASYLPLPGEWMYWRFNNCSLHSCLKDCVAKIME